MAEGIVVGDARAATAVVKGVTLAHPPADFEVTMV